MNSTTIDEMIAEVKANYPHLNVPVSKETLTERMIKAPLPDDNLVWLVYSYLIRSCFVIQPVRPTEEQSDDVADLHHDLRLLKEDIKRSGYKGKFALILFGYVFELNINPKNDEYNDVIIVSIHPIAGLEVLEP